MSSGQTHNQILPYAVGLRVDLDAMERNLFPSSSWEANHNISDIQPVAERLCWLT